MAKKKAYMVSYQEKGNVNQGVLNIGIEYMGTVYGRLLAEDGTLLGQHTSSSYGWLRHDLSNKLGDSSSEYEIIDLIGKELPETLKHLKG